MNHRVWALLALMSVASVTLAGCVAEEDSSETADDEEDEVAESFSEELRSVVDCKAQTATAYVKGVSRSISVITVGGKPVAKPAGHAFLKMQRAADAAGVSLSVISGFRTMAQQQRLYDCYRTKSCNNGNLAARPGYSNHQSGIALDLTTSSWLAKNAGRFGFVRTVPSEAWHYEYRGADPGGVCGN